MKMIKQFFYARFLSKIESEWWDVEEVFVNCDDWDSGGDDSGGW